MRKVPTLVLKFRAVCKTCAICIIDLTNHGCGSPGREGEREGGSGEKKRRASIEFLVAESGPEMSHWGNTTKRREEGEEGHAASTIKLPSHQQQQQQSEYMCASVCVRACVRSVKSLCKCAVSKTSPNHTGSVFLDP